MYDVRIPSNSNSKQILTRDENSRYFSQKFVDFHSGGVTSTCLLNSTGYLSEKEREKEREGRREGGGDKYAHLK